MKLNVEIKHTLLLLTVLGTMVNVNGQWTTIDVGNSGETTLFEHTGTSSPVPFNLRKSGYSGSSVSYGILHLDMAHNVLGGGSNIHFRLKNSSGAYKEYGGLGAYIVDNTSGSEDGALGFYTSNNGNFRQRRMTILNTGNVGIGTISPSEKLSVNGNIQITGDLKMSGSDSYIWTNGTGTGYTGIWDQKNSRVLLYTSESSGNVGIGTTNPDSKLSVNGRIHTKEVKVDLIGWSDFVFYDDYQLPTLREVEEHIKTKGHLKDIPSAKDVEENGILLGEMDAKLLQKIEELTLYTINQEKRIDKLEAKNKNMEKENEELRTLADMYLKLQERLEKLASKK